MKSATKLKDQARKHEQKEEWQQAIDAYLQVLEGGDDGDAEVELPLYNRIGDLCIRLGRAEDAVGYYEEAADRYARAGLYNNAIALCNKALRYVPDRLEVLRKLGEFSASQGFVTDARRWYLEYAEKMSRAGQVDAAFAALRRFADTSEDPSIRELLAERLQTSGRNEEAVAELRRAWQMRMDSGETRVADALRVRIRRLDPEASLEMPSESDGAPAGETGGFGDAAWAAGAAATGDAEVGEAEAWGDYGEAASWGDDVDDEAGQEVPFEGDFGEAGPYPGPDGAAGVAGEDPHAAASDGGRDAAEPELLDLPETGGLEGFQTTGYDDHAAEAGDVEVIGLDGLEGTGLAHGVASHDEDAGLEGVDVRLTGMAGEEDDTGEDEDRGFGPYTGGPGEDEGGMAALALEEDEDEAFRLPEVEAAPRGIPMPPIPRERAAAEEPTAAAPAREEDPDQAPAAPLDSAQAAESTAAPAEEPAESEEPAEWDEPAAAAEPTAAPAEEPAQRADATAAAAPPEPPAENPAAEEFVDLAALLADEMTDAGTRFVMAETAPSGDEDRDFAELLSQFKARVAEGVAPEDADSHYDLGLAFKEMGLVDEAIAEFQVALRGGHQRLRIFEELGHCFLLKDQHGVALKILEAALRIPHDDALELIGVHYHMGRAHEALGRNDEARESYERVLGLDIHFADVGERLARL